MADISATVITAIDAVYTGVKDLYRVVRDLKPSDIGDYEGDTERLALSIEMTKEKLYNIDEQQLNYAQKAACHKIRVAVLDAEDLLDRVETLIMKKKLNEGYDSNSSFISGVEKKAKDFLFKFTKAAGDNIQSAIKEINIKLDDIQKYLKNFELQKHSHKESTRNMIARASGSQVNAITIIGRDGDKKKVIERLLKAYSMGKQPRIPVVAIVGMGGMGKTTLAQLVFDDEILKQDCNFELRLWVSDSKRLDLPLVLKSILKSISPSDSSMIDNLEETQLKDRLAKEINGKRFLLVLDDVENEDHLCWLNLKGLLSNRNKEGSRVLITTRSKRVARSMGASTYQLEGLSNEDSLQLFESIAFDEIRDEKLVPIGKRIVEKCAGVPLAIKVIGAFLYPNQDNIVMWEDMVSDLGKDNQIMAILKMSYDDLDSILKQCFSLCALFPKNSRISKGILSGIWKANMSKEILSGVCTTNLEILCNRCFLEVSERCHGDEDTYYKMHDLMHDLAEKVAGTEMLVDFDGMGDRNKLIVGKTVRHLSLLSHEMRNSKELICELQGRRLRTFIRYSEQPLPFDIDKLVSNCPVIRFLDLQGYSIGNLTDSIGKLIHLRYLNLCSTDVCTFDSVNELINLQYLCLRKCKALTHLHSGVCDLTSLYGLDISRCGKLEEIPMKVEKLTNLRYFTLKECKALTHLPSGVGGLRSLQVLELSCCEKLEELPREVEKLTNLKYLFLNECKALTHWPSGVVGLTNLVMLDISSCENLKDLPKEIEKLTKLKILYLKEWKTLTQLPSGVGMLTSLEILDICSCENLEELPREVGKLTNLNQLYLKECKSLTQLPSEVGGLTSLEVLDISCCLKLEELPREVEKLTNLKHFYLKECKALTYWPSGVVGLIDLEKLDISSCENLKELPMEIENLTKLKHLYLKEWKTLTHLPSAVGGLTSLEELDISCCGKLEELPREVEKLTNLKHLYLKECKTLTHLPSTVGGLTSLEVLDMSFCEKLEKLPMEVENLTNLKHLYLKECKALIHFPSGVGGLTSLEVLDISTCGKANELSREVWKLTNLKYLY